MIATPTTVGNIDMTGSYDTALSFIFLLMFVLLQGLNMFAHFA